MSEEGHGRTRGEQVVVAEGGGGVDDLQGEGGKVQDSGERREVRGGTRPWERIVVVCN